MAADRTPPRSDGDGDGRPDRRAQHLELVKEYSAVIEALWRVQPTDVDYRELIARKRRIQSRLVDHGSR